MAAELPPKLKGMSDDEYLKILVNSYNSNLLVRITGNKMTYEQARTMADKSKLPNLNN